MHASLEVVTVFLVYNCDLGEELSLLYSFPGRMHWKQPLKKVPSYVSTTSSTSPIRRSVSCPRSISALTMQIQADKRPFTAKPAMLLSRSSLASRSHSLNRGSSAIKVSHTANQGSVHSSGVS